MLTPSQLSKARNYNNNNAARVGWPADYTRVAAVLGLGQNEPTPDAFANAVDSWQSNITTLNNDGKLGPKSWRMMRTAPANPTVSVPPPAWAVAATTPSTPTGPGPLWLQHAQAEKQLWDREIASWTSSSQRGAAEAHMSRDEGYFLASPYFGGRVKDRGTVPSNAYRADWCAAFVNWCLHTAGYSHTGSAGAHSFVVRRLWKFHALTEPRRGCVTVVGNGDRGSHVAFIWETANLPTDPGGNVTIRGNRKLKILGGNQGQRITVKNEKRRMLAARGHNGVTSPYLWPIRGAATCNHDPATEQGHFCGRVH